MYHFDDETCMRNGCVFSTIENQTDQTSPFATQSPVMIEYLHAPIHPPPESLRFPPLAVPGYQPLAQNYRHSLGRQLEQTGFSLLLYLIQANNSRGDTRCLQKKLLQLWMSCTFFSAPNQGLTSHQRQAVHRRVWKTQRIGLNAQLLDETGKINAHS